MVDDDSMKHLMVSYGVGKPAATNSKGVNVLEEMSFVFSNFFYRS